MKTLKDTCIHCARLFYCLDELEPVNVLARLLVSQNRQPMLNTFHSYCIAHSIQLSVGVDQGDIIFIILLKQYR